LTNETFEAFGFAGPLARALTQCGYATPTPIQQQALPPQLADRDLLGLAETGSGKTATFLLPILNKIATSGIEPGWKQVVALILAPTRELVVQIIKDANVLGKHAGLRCLAVYGGTDYAAQQRAVETQPLDLIAATPGRLLDFHRSKILSLSKVNILVIDEADRMLDMGFIPDVRKIIFKLPPQDKRQTLLFSATLDEQVMRLASAWMPNPVKIEVDAEHAVLDTIRQLVYPIAAREKFTVLYNLLKSREGKRFLIFRNRKSECDQLCRELASYGIDTEQLSGDVDQKKRLRVLEDFRSGKKRILIATDVAGRGIHIDDIGYVVNYDFPYQADDYIHRIGRTGRAGATGTAISFACEDESFIIPEIEKILGEELHCQQPDAPLFAPLPPRVAQLEPSKHDRRPRHDEPRGTRRPFKGRR
jgi:ATP-dependent RNA helicase RhlB